MSAAGIREDLERGKLGPCLHALLPELDDIDPTRQDCLEEVGEVRLLGTRIRTQIQPRCREPAAPPGGATYSDFVQRPAVFNIRVQSHSTDGRRHGQAGPRPGRA